MNDLPDDSLDTLLNEGDWPEPSPATEARLSRRWQDVWSAQTRRESRTRWAAALAVAACLTAAAMVGWHVALGTAKIPQNPNLGSSPTEMARREPSPPIEKLPAANSAAIDDLAPSRPPDALEHMLAVARLDRRRPRATKIRRKPPTTSNTDRFVAAAIDCLVSDPAVDPAIAASGLLPDLSQYERPLIDALSRSNLSERIAAARLLGRVGGPTAVAALIQAGEDPSVRPAAVDALCRLAESPVLAELASKGTDRAAQHLFLKTLLARGDRESLELYLNFVEDYRSNGVALAAAGSIDNPPMDLLFATLQSTSQPRRIAAAQVIGRIDGSATTQRLIAMIERGAFTQEAFVALLSSRGEEAVRYVAAARRDAMLASLLQAASLSLPIDPSSRSSS